MCDLFYETAHFDGNSDFPVITTHDDLDAAITFANAREIRRIYEYGGNYEIFEKCDFCGEWFPSSEIGADGYCDTCTAYIRGREGV